METENDCLGRSGGVLSKQVRFLLYLSLFVIFYFFRFSERNQWYKARIQMPEHLPELYIIQPTDYYRTLAERLQGNLKHFYLCLGPLTFLDDVNKCLLDIGFKKRPVEPIKTDLDKDELEKRSRRNECKYLFTR
jgi:hypothetical protein